MLIYTHETLFRKTIFIYRNLCLVLLLFLLLARIQHLLKDTYGCSHRRERYEELQRTRKIENEDEDSSQRCFSLHNRMYNITLLYVYLLYKYFENFVCKDRAKEIDFIASTLGQVRWWLCFMSSCTTMSSIDIKWTRSLGGRWWCGLECNGYRCACLKWWVNFLLFNFSLKSVET